MKRIAGYWGDEYLDSIKHEMGVGDGDPAPDLPASLDVPEVVKPVVAKQYAELLANEAPDPKYFLQGIQVAVLDYFDGKVEPYTREADIIKILADGFATEEFFGWRGGSPEYSFWTLHSNEINDLAKAIGVDQDQLFDDLGKLAIVAAEEEGAKLTQEIQEARAGVDETIASFVEENWNQPIAKIVALWNDFLDHGMENPRDVTVEDLLALLDPAEPYFDRYDDSFAEEFKEAAEQELPRLAREILRAPDPRQQELSFPKRRGRPQKKFYKKSEYGQERVMPTVKQASNVADDLLQELVSQCHLDQAKARQLYDSAIAANSHEEVDAVLAEANQMLDGHGVEGLNPEGAWVNHYYQNIVALYVNLGDPYKATLLYDTDFGVFVVAGWGDFLETWEQENGAVEHNAHANSKERPMRNQQRRAVRKPAHPLVLQAYQICDQAQTALFALLDRMGKENLGVNVNDRPVLQKALRGLQTVAKVFENMPHGVDYRDLEPNRRGASARLAAVDWLPDHMSSGVHALVGNVSAAIKWDILDAAAFSVALLEDVNAHPEARAVNDLLEPMVLLSEEAHEELMQRGTRGASTHLATKERPMRDVDQQQIVNNLLGPVYRAFQLLQEAMIAARNDIEEHFVPMSTTDRTAFRKARDMVADARSLVSSIGNSTRGASSRLAAKDLTEEELAALSSAFNVLNQNQFGDLAKQLSQAIKQIEGKGKATASTKQAALRRKVLRRHAARRQAAFMEPTVEQGTWVEIDGPTGTEWLPADLVNLDDVEALAQQVADQGTASLEGSSLRDYSENEEIYEIKIVDGFSAYLSAPGYMDRTNNVVFPTKEEAEAYLAEQYGDEEVDDSGDEGDEAPSQEEINESIAIGQQGDQWLAYYNRKPLITAESDTDLFAQLRAWAEKEGFYPSIYQVNDHGNVTAYDYEGNVVGEWV